MPRVIAGRSDHQQTPGAAGPGSQREAKPPCRAEPAGWGQQLTQRGDLVRVHEPIVPDNPAVVQQPAPLLPLGKYNATVALAPGAAPEQWRRPVIDLDRDGNVWILRMRDGENRFNRGFVDGFHAALDRVEAAEGPRALVTTGDQKFYSNGLDLDWLAAVGADASAFLDGVHRLFGRLAGFPAVTVAAVNGHAFGDGAVLALAHDFAVMRHDRGYWCLPEADLGLPLTPEMFAVIAAKLPARTAQEAILTGRRWAGPDAAAAGIVRETAAADRVVARAVEVAAGLAAKDRATLAQHKRLLYAEAIKACGG